MHKLLAIVVACSFALSTGSAFAASHAGAKMEDKDKKSEVKKDDKKKKKAGKKKDEPKT